MDEVELIQVEVRVAHDGLRRGSVVTVGTDDRTRALLERGYIVPTYSGRGVGGQPPAWALPRPPAPAGPAREPTRGQQRSSKTVAVPDADTRPAAATVSAPAGRGGRRGRQGQTDSHG